MLLIIICQSDDKTQKHLKLHSVNSTNVRVSALRLTVFYIYSEL